MECSPRGTIMEYKKSQTSFFVMYIGVKMDILLVCKGNARREGGGEGHYEKDSLSNAIVECWPNFDNAFVQGCYLHVKLLPKKFFFFLKQKTYFKSLP